MEILKKQPTILTKKIIIIKVKIMKELVKYVKEVNRNIGYKIYQARLERDVSREELAKYYTSSCRLAEFKLIT